MKNKAIPIVLLLCLAATFFFWFQVRRVKDLPPTNPASGGTTKEVEEFITLVHEVSASEPPPLPDLSGMPDPFVIPKPKSDNDNDSDKKEPLPVLSSISYSNLNALAVVNGEIVAEGDTIPGSNFMIEDIEVGKVEISDGKKKHTLEIPPDIGKGR